jgi:hypothetical protein
LQVDYPSEFINIYCDYDKLVIALLNIVINAVLSIPSPFQQFAFEQPNVAVLYFPFVWLPCCIVPIVLFAHLAAIKQLWNKKQLS